MSHKNFVAIDPQVIETMCSRYRSGTTIDALMSEFGYGRNKIIRTLKEILGAEYDECGKQIRLKASSRAGKRNIGRKNPHTIEWNAKIAAANVGLGHTAETKATLSCRNKERELDPAWQARKPEITRKIVEGKRARGYFELHAKRHGELMRSRERETQVMSKRAKALWRQGAFTYGSEKGIMRSKLEIRTYELIRSHYPDAEHTWPIHTEERSYHYDVFVPSLNTLIEINGDFWHCNPELRSEDEWAKVRNVRHVWKADEEKAQVAIEHGYRFVTLWEKDLLENEIRSCEQALEQRKECDRPQEL